MFTRERIKKLESKMIVHKKNIFIAVHKDQKYVLFEPGVEAKVQNVFNNKEELNIYMSTQKGMVIFYNLHLLSQAYLAAISSIASTV